MADRTYRIGIEIDTRMRVDEQAAQKVREAVSGATRPLSDLGKTATDMEAKFKKALAAVEAEEAAFGRSTKTLREHIAIRRDLTRDLGVRGRTLPEEGIFETRGFEQQLQRRLQVERQVVTQTRNLIREEREERRAADREARLIEQRRARAAAPLLRFQRAEFAVGEMERAGVDRETVLKFQRSFLAQAVRQPELLRMDPTLPQRLAAVNAELLRMQNEGRKAGLSLKILGQEVSFGRVIAWGLAWNLGYRAINSVTQLISGSTIGAIRTLAEFQQRQIALAAELVNIDPARPFDEAMQASRGLLNTLTQLQPGFIGTAQRLQEVLVGTQRYGIAVDLVSETGRRQFLTFANAIALTTAGIDRQGQALQEIRSLAEGVIRPGAQLLQILRAVDPQISEHIKLWRAEGTVIENVVRLLPGYEQALARIGNTLQGQWNQLAANVERFKRILGEIQEGPAAGFLRTLNEILRILIHINESAERLGISAGNRELMAAVARLGLVSEFEARAAITRARGAAALGRRRVREFEEEPPSLDDLLRMFERRRTLRQFTAGGEIRALSEILIPRAVSDLKEAREEYERFLRARGPGDEETARRLKEVHRLELDLTRLEGQRIGLAERLGQEYRRQADSLERAAEAVLDISEKSREAAAGVGIGAAGLFESLLRGQLGGRTAGGVREAFGGIREQQEFVFRQRRALLDQAEREVRGESRIGERERQERLARIAQERIRLLFDETEARARLNREEREALRNAKQRDTDAELVFLRQKLQILKSIGDEQQAQNVRTRIQEIEKQQEFGADVAGLSTAQIRQLISESTRAILSGRLSLSQDRQMRERVEALQRRLRELEEERATEAGGLDRARQAAKEAAGIYTDVLGPAFEFLRGEAESVADAALKRTQELHGDIVAAWGRMGTDAAAAFRRGFEDEFGRGPGLFGPPQPAAPGRGPRNDLMQPTASRTNFTHSGANIFINGMEIALSESAKQEIVSAVMGGQGDVAMARERRLVGPGAVA